MCVCVYAEVQKKKPKAPTYSLLEIGRERTLQGRLVDSLSLFHTTRDTVCRAPITTRAANLMFHLHFKTCE